MPLIVATLQGELIGALEKGPMGNPAPPLVGINIAKAYNNYCSSAMNVGAGSFTGMPGVSSLGQELGDILSATSPAGALTALKMATAFNNCLSTLLTVHQIAIVTAPGLPVLQAGLTQVLSTPAASATMFAQQLATQLNTFTMMAIVSGSIPGTPPVPFTGPLS